MKSAACGPTEEVIATLRNKPADKHVIATGRNAREEFIEIADLVTGLQKWSAVRSLVAGGGVEIELTSAILTCLRAIETAPMPEANEEILNGK